MSKSYKENELIKTKINIGVIESIINTENIWGNFSINKFKDIITDLKWDWQVIFKTSSDGISYILVYDEFNNHILTINITEGMVFYGKTAIYKNGGAGFSKVRKF